MFLIGSVLHVYVGKRIIIIHCLPVYVVGFKGIASINASCYLLIIQRHAKSYAGESLPETVDCTA